MLNPRLSKLQHVLCPPPPPTCPFCVCRDRGDSLTRHCNRVHNVTERCPSSDCLSHPAKRKATSHFHSGLALRPAASGQWLLPWQPHFHPFGTHSLAEQLSSITLQAERVGRPQINPFEICSGGAIVRLIPSLKRALENNHRFIQSAVRGAKRIPTTNNRFMTKESRNQSKGGKKNKLLKSIEYMMPAAPSALPCLVVRETRPLRARRL